MRNASVSGIGLQSLGGCSQDDHSENLRIFSWEHSWVATLPAFYSQHIQTWTRTELMVKKHNTESRNKFKDCSLPQGKHLCDGAVQTHVFLWMFFEVVAYECSAYSRTAALLQASQCSCKSLLHLALLLKILNGRGSFTCRGQISNCAAGFGASTRNEVLESCHMHQWILNQGEGLRNVWRKCVF